MGSNSSMVDSNDFIVNITKVEMKGSNSSMVDSNSPIMTRIGSPPVVQIPLWSIVTRPSSLLQCILCRSNSSMVDSNLVATDIRSPRGQFKFLYGR